MIEHVYNIECDGPITPLQKKEQINIVLSFSSQLKMLHLDSLMANFFHFQLVMGH